MQRATSRPRLRWWHLRRPVRIALGAAAAGYVLILLIAMFFEESLIFFPASYPDGEWKPAGLEFEDAWFEAADGTRLHGWYVPHAAPRAVVLFAPGNAGNLTYRTDRLRWLQRRVGLAVMIFDYRGYGRSAGRPDEAGILADARAARRWLAERAGVAEDRIVLMGESLGAAVMVDLAAKDGARGMILENAFTSLPDAGAYHYPLLPLQAMMRNRLDSLSKIGSYQGPLLASHGDVDRVVPIALGERLFAAANEPKRFVRLPGHDHNDPIPPAWYEEIDAFIGTLPP